MIFCTVTSNKHLVLAKVMAKSVKEHHPGSKVVMCLVEEDLSYAAPHLSAFDHVVLAKDLGFPNFYSHMFKHSDYEGPGSCKARVLQFVFNMYPAENKFIYIDSDMKVYGPLEEVDRILDSHPIILTPHLLRPVDYDLKPNIEFLQNKNGIYNSGFLALRRSTESLQFLNWWVSKLDHWCFVDYKKGTFGDQRWLDQIPVLFNAFILKHPGYNAAWWNHPERILTITDGRYTVNSFPLRCFHFSGVLALNSYPEFLRHHFPDPNDPIHQLTNQYIIELNQAIENFTVNIPWSYSCFQSGEPISITSRLNFRNSDGFSHIQNPFLLSNHFFMGNDERLVKKEKITSRNKNLKNRRKKINKRYKNIQNSGTEKKLSRRIKLRSAGVITRNNTINRVISRNG